MNIENPQVYKPHILLVNNNYEKMAARKRAIKEGNEKATAINNKIKKKQHANIALSLIFGILLAAVVGYGMWFFTAVSIFTLPIEYSKLLLGGIAALCVFVIIEGFSIARNKALARKKQNILTVTEAINFVTCIKDKTIEEYSVQKYNEEPCLTQRAYVTFFLDDGLRKSEYTSTEKWTITPLPTLFDVVVDAENTTIYVPVKDENIEDYYKLRLENKVCMERLRIEQGARSQAEVEVASLLTQKSTLEQLVSKSHAAQSELQRKLDETQTELIVLKTQREDTIKTVGEQHEKEKAELRALVDAREAEKKQSLEELEKANAELVEKDATEKQLRDNIKALEDSTAELQAFANNCESEKDQALNKLEKANALIAEKNATEERIKADIKTLENDANKAKEDAAKLREELGNINKARAAEIATLKAAAQNHLNEANEKHASEIIELKESFAAAAQGAKSALEQKYTKEIDLLTNKYEEKISSLEGEIQRLSSETDSVETINALTAEKEQLELALQAVRAELESEVKIRNTREKELKFEEDKIKTLEEKLNANKQYISELKQSFNTEKQKLLSENERVKKAADAAKAAAAASVASSGVQERALVKERDALLKTNEALEAQLKTFEALQEENSSLKKELAETKSADVEELKKNYEERLAAAREDKAKAEAKMREALQSAAQEKADRIKSEEALKKHLSDIAKAEADKKEAEHQAVMAQARQAAEKAKQDAENGKKDEPETTVKRPARRLTF